MIADLDPHVVFVALSGSHAYGTARPGSDVDLRGCCIAPPRVRLSFRQEFEQWSYVGHEHATPPNFGPRFRSALARAGEHPSAGLEIHVATPDAVIYELTKLVGLCARQNPNTLELLFVDEREILLTTPLWERLRARRHEFLSQKVRHTFAGYARGQLDRIRTHRQWLLHPPDHAPTRAEFGLPEQSSLSADERNRIEESIALIIRGWSVDEGIELPGAERDVLRERMREFWTACLLFEPPAGAVHSATHDRVWAPEEGPDAPLSTHATLSDQQLDLALADRAGASLGLGKLVLETLRNERRYRSARRHWEQFQRWQRERNPARAALEAKHGYDTKHGMHLIRLLRMGVEVLRTGEVKVRREDAEELLAIRDGALPYDDLLTQADALDQAMREALHTTKLPAEVDETALDELLIELIEAHWSAFASR